MMGEDEATAGAMPGQAAGPANRIVLRMIVDAWKRYPEEIAIPSPDEIDPSLFAQILGLLVREQALHATSSSIALTPTGYEAVEQACRDDQRLSVYAQAGKLPSSPAISTSLVLSILRAHHQLRTASRRQ